MFISIAGTKKQEEHELKRQNEKAERGDVVRRDTKGKDLRGAPVTPANKRIGFFRGVFYD